MLRRQPHSSMFIRTVGFLRQQLNWLAGDTNERLQAGRLLPVRLRRMASPSVRSLEPRFVLNATAELNALGQLVVMGTDSAETVALQVESDGRIRLRDGAGDVISITSNPDSEFDSLDPSSITSNQVIFDLRDGNDTVQLELPPGLEIIVLESRGNDSTVISGDGATAISTGGLRIDSETIRFDPAVRSIASSSDVALTGSVTVGNAGDLTELSNSNGGFVVDGRFTIAGDVHLNGAGGVIDLSQAITSASSSNANLTIDANSGDVLVGTVNDSAGSALNDLRIDSAASLQFTGPLVEIEGDLVAKDILNATTIDSTVAASSVSIVGEGAITVNERITTVEKGIEFSSSNVVSVKDDFNTTLANEEGDIDIRGSLVSLSTLRMLTSGGNVQVEGDVSIDGLVILDSGNRQGAAIAGDVNIVGSVQGNNGVLDVLRVDARGGLTNGDVMISGDIGNTLAGSDPIDLNGVIVDGKVISIQNVSVSSGDIRFTGDAIESRGTLIRTSMSGDILIDAPLWLGPTDTTVSSAGSARFTKSVQGQQDTGNLIANAGGSALFDASVSGIQELRVNAVNVARFSGPTVIDGEMTVDGESIRILGDVTTSDDSVTLNSTAQTLIASNAVVAVGDAMITIDAGGGTIDAGGGTISSQASGDAIQLQNASSLILGNTIAPNGNLQINDIVGSVIQSAGSSVTVDRLTALQTGEVILGNASNDIRSIERIDANGRVTINDSVDGLIVNQLDSTGSDVTITVTGDLLLGDNAVTAIGAVARIEALTINDMTDSTATDIKAQRVELKATQGVGNTSQIDLGGVSRLRAETVSGGVDIAHIATGPLVVESITANQGDVNFTQSGVGQQLDLVSIRSGNGEIDIVANGTVTARSLVSEKEDQDISVKAIGIKSDILVGLISALNESDVQLEADDDVLTFEEFDKSLIVADDLAVVARNGCSDGSQSIALRTQVNDLVANTATPANRGDIRIVELDNINLASSDAADNEIVTAVNGQILVNALNITVVDTGVGNEDANLKGDPEIVAAGLMGRVVLKATNTLTLGDDVQIHAYKMTPERPGTQPLPDDDGLTEDDRAVVLKGNAVVFSNDIEIFTGKDQGTARIFGPRPSVIPDDVTTERPIKLGPTRNGNQQLDANGNVIPSAFYDPDSITVNVLEQAAINDANGILTVDIGRQGERGLSVEIDWGAGSDDRRFQQLNNLSADDDIFFDVTETGELIEKPQTQSSDAGRLRVTHFYSQADILGSEFNGRVPGTGPLNVLFAVRHHESILVEANTITQQSVTDNVPKAGSDQHGLASSTDVRGTARNAEPGLESGSVSFIIPSLSIPVAFFPVREVIPEIETPQFIVRPVSTSTVAPTAIEAVESVTATTSTREEYFRLRVLSPDPNGEDLAEPERLPEDILDGEKLRTLFKQLPDGTYQIEYVLGDGDERTILSVEVRNGAAKLSAGDLEEGVLQLKRIKESQK